MADPRAFISFDFDNNSTERTLFVGQAKNSRTPFNIEDWSSKGALPQKEWEELIEAKINKCNMVIVLVGEKTHTAKGVVKEIAFAKSQDVPVFGVYVGKANEKTDLPDGLARSRVIAWEWEKIADKVDQMMKEGKNKK
jgi:CTP synthase (UTP-ammonia lyase)